MTVSWGVSFLSLLVCEALWCILRLLHWAFPWEWIVPLLTLLEFALVVLALVVLASTWALSRDSQLRMPKVLRRIAIAAGILPLLLQVVNIAVNRPQ